MKVFVYEFVNGSYCFLARFCKEEEAYLYKETKQKHTDNPIVIAKILLF